MSRLLPIWQRLLPLVLLASLGIGPAVQPAKVSSAVTGKLSGVVISGGDVPTPVRRAAVTLTGETLEQTTLTDDLGRFTFEGLIPGRYSLLVRKSGYVPTHYGAGRIGAPGVFIRLSGGQALDDLVVRLPRGGVIAGSLRDAEGKPAANVLVRVAAADSDRSYEAVTDDRGAYRTFGLLPGVYYVAAIPTMAPVDAPALTAGVVDAVLSALGESGNTRRPGIPESNRGEPGAGGAAAARRDTDSYAYAPTYYPGSANFAFAAGITVGAGQEHTGIDFPITLVRTTRVRVLVEGPSGEPHAGARVTVMSSPKPPRAFALSTIAQSTGADGTAQVRGISPGRYTVVASVERPAANSGQAVAVLFGMIDVEVAGQGSEDVVVGLRATRRVTGRVFFDGARPAAVADLARQVRVRLSPAQPGSAALPVVATARPDGSFVIDGIVPERYRLSADLSDAEPGWWLQWAVLDQRDLLEEALDVRDIGDAVVVLTFSDKRTRLTGVVTGAADAEGGYSVVAFPTERAHWLPHSRRMISVRPDSDGSFVLEGLPAGEYRVAAVPTELEWRNAEFLETLVSSSVKVVLEPGLGVQVALRAPEPR